MRQPLPEEISRVVDGLSENEVIKLALTLGNIDSPAGQEKETLETAILCDSPAWEAGCAVGPGSTRPCAGDLPSMKSVRSTESQRSG